MSGKLIVFEGTDGSGKATQSKLLFERLQREGIAVVSTSLGGDVGRRVQFWPACGRARQMFMSAQEAVPPPQVRLPPAQAGFGDVELF